MGGTFEAAHESVREVDMTLLEQLREQIRTEDEDGHAAAWGGGGLLTIILIVLLLVLIF